jgi:hypothetical protein
MQGSIEMPVLRWQADTPHEDVQASIEKEGDMMMRLDTPQEKLYRIENILASLDRMTESPHYQKTVGVDEMNKRAIQRIKEVVF